MGEPYARRNVGRSVRPEHIARFHDEYGACEWERFDLSSMDRVGLEVHLRLLRALAELLRVTKPGGSLLLTVTSLLGTARAFFEQLSGLVDEFGWQRAVVDVFETGDLDHVGSSPHRPLEQGDRRRKRRSRAQAPSVTG